MNKNICRKNIEANNMTVERKNGELSYVMKYRFLKIVRSSSPWLKTTSCDGFIGQKIGSKKVRQTTLNEKRKKWRKRVMVREGRQR